MGDGTQQGGSEGIATLVLWSRMRDRRFEVEVTFGPEGVGPGPLLSGKIACKYSEYTSRAARRGGKPENGGRIPGLEEMLRFLPKWVVVMKTADGLVEVLRSFLL